jgi:hypothetical protein
VVQQAFIHLGDFREFPGALSAVAAAARVSLFEAGRLCFLLWKYKLAVEVPEDAIEPLRLLLPDRRLGVTQEPVGRTRRLSDLVEQPGGSGSTGRRAFVAVY